MLPRFAGAMPHAVPRTFDDAADLIGLDRFPSPGDRFDLEVARLLLARRTISLTGLAMAMQRRAEGGMTLAQCILAGGLITASDYYRAVAACYGLPFVDLVREPADPSLATGKDQAEYAARSLRPWRLREGRLVLAVSSISRETVEWADARFGPDGYDFVIAAPI